MKLDWFTNFGLKSQFYCKYVILILFGNEILLVYTYILKSESKYLTWVLIHILWAEQNATTMWCI